MKRVRLATWAALAGLTLLSGCQMSDPCRPSLLERMRLCGRPRASAVTYEPPMNGSTFGGVPMGEYPITSYAGPECCDGPVLPPSNGFGGEHGFAPGHDSG